MEWLFIIIAGASLILGTFLSLTVYRARWDRAAHSSPTDPEALSKQMLASAQNEQELEFLKEMDELELHRRHIVC